MAILVPFLNESNGVGFADPTGDLINGMQES
jgi:hypothetical protein